MPSGYRGRFAPSPTGPLHFGSLVAAMASYLDARAHGGQWLVRMEDVDSPRVVPGAAEEILRTLEACGMAWDGPVVYQSARSEAYRRALDALREGGKLYPCACSRREIADSAIAGIDGYVYPGTCRNGLPPGREARAWRVRAIDEPIVFEDAIQGRVEQSLGTQVGDYVLHRADGVYAYQLAVTVDDAEQGVTHVVRGADLLDSTPRQIFLQRLLGLPTPHYAHVPVAANAAGEKLSKQTYAPPVERDRPHAEMLRALLFLGQAPPPSLANASPREILDWGAQHWRLDRIPRVRAVSVASESRSA